MTAPEPERTSSNSPSSSKTSLPYPAFSKAHSKEAIRRDSAPNPRLSYHTPDPTDLAKNDEENEQETRPGKGVTPPSPPETTMDQKIKLESTKKDTVRLERKKTDLQKAADDLKRRLGMDSSRGSEVSKRRSSQSSKPRNENKESGKFDARSTSSPRTSKPSTPSKLRPRAATVEDAETSGSYRKTSSSVHSSKSEGTTDSDATSIAPNQASSQRPFTPQANHDSSPPTEPDSSEPRTPTLPEAQIPSSRKQTPAFSVQDARSASRPVEESPMPPPPPPAPAEVPTPRVDYLLQNGGLPNVIQRCMLAASPPSQTNPSTSTTKTQAEGFFSPFTGVLEDYAKVMSRRGSLAVATGYRSVARRLLDRLEAVFARDISSETCHCEICQRSQEMDQEPDDKRGVSWGEILEYVCGRQELPIWPPFAFDSAGLGISNPEQLPPMQKLDIDVPDEFREHYIRQSKRTKQAVDKWLENQPAEPANLPSEVDDETLTFAMLTKLDADQRPIFSSILGVAPSRPASALPDKPTGSIMPPTSELLQSTSLAIQRLYRLPSSPRDPESAMYLLVNPSIHNVLATLAAISDGEWDILISGRFDGFLRSGAEDDIPTPTVGNIPLPFARGATRTPSFLARPSPAAASTSSNLATPPSRGPTPFSSQKPFAGAPVALDEETEIAALAEIEREIFLGMEALEDAFEALHVKAENVRQALRERGAGLAQASQSRGMSNFAAGELGGVSSRMSTPASFASPGIGLAGNWESETDDGIDDAVSELAPDDSASNVSRSRVRRPRRRTERRTPAPVEEVDEEGEKGK